MTPSITAYHIATRCGTPSGPIVAIVAVRCCAMNVSISSSVIVICARWLVPMRSEPKPAGPAPKDRPCWTNGLAEVEVLRDTSGQGAGCSGHVAGGHLELGE